MKGIDICWSGGKHKCLEMSRVMEVNLPSINLINQTFHVLTPYKQGGVLCREKNKES